MQRARRPNRNLRRGGDNTHNHSNPSRKSPSYTSIPAISALHPGTPVSIVLKADQPTGHQVSGIIADLLTRGDHPRGVKVRLRDGRVGRVQKLVSEEEGLRGEDGAGRDAGVGRDGEAARGAGGNGGGLTYRHVTDIREDGSQDYLYDEARRPDFGGLFGALEAADARHAGSSGGGRSAAEGGESGESEMATCPVCGEFEGDERAVAHHVEGHF
ncbi:hypothetical protein BDV95DRAFT_277160 [Massariosphaeria phaeospora]|uniref:Uncharacterized protein n=1 Tax=Massariosphaeria phaeospora TaxID=100035 RepID=A0A7C8IDY0_9PLEO|nr:hypothetical protein BDV95DRAFT_277160 [Massariosphaeria phaeospora]